MNAHHLTYLGRASNYSRDIPLLYNPGRDAPTIITISSIYPEWSAGVDTSGASDWMEEDIVEKGLYAAYLYVRRSQTPCLDRFPDEDRAVHDLERQHPKCFTALSGFFGRRAQQGRLTEEQVTWGTSGLRDRLRGDLQNCSISMREGEFVQAVEAHKRVMTDICNWVACEPIWRLTIVVSVYAYGGPARGKNLKIDERKQSYEEMLRGCRMITKMLKESLLAAR